MVDCVPSAMYGALMGDTHMGRLREKETRGLSGLELETGEGPGEIEDYY